MAQAFDSVLMIGYGGPETSDDVRPFLDNVLQGRRVPPERIEEVVHHYERVGGGSPFNELTRRQAAALEAVLAGAGTPLPVRFGARHWHPFLVDVLREMAERGERRAIGLIMAPHQCHSSFEQYAQNVEDARVEIGPQAPLVEYVDPWYDQPGFVEALAEGVARCLEATPPNDREQAELIFTAHSIPQPMAEASLYVPQFTETARMVATRTEHQKWSLAYQSRSGRPEDPWLEPDICDVLRDRAAAGTRHVVVVPAGFVCDHVEVLYDLDVEAAEVAAEVGIAMQRAPTVGDHPKFIEALAGQVRSLMKR